MLCKCSGKYIDIYFNLKITFMGDGVCTVAISLVVKKLLFTAYFHNQNEKVVKFFKENECYHIVMGIWKVAYMACNCTTRVLDHDCDCHQHFWKLFDNIRFT